MRNLIPNPFDTLEQLERYRHLDLRCLTDEEVLDELWGLRPRLWKLQGSDQGAWLRERVKMLEAEWQRRRSQKVRRR